MNKVEIENKVDELLVSLTKDIEHIQQSLSNLDELRCLVIKRDDSALGRLLERIQAESDSYRQQESKRQAIRQKLANSLGCPVKDLTLSKLEVSTTDGTKERIIRAKAVLRELIGKLRKEYSSTAMLLSECARFNNMLLRSIFNLGRNGVVYYNADGTTRRQSETAFVNLQF